MAIYSAIRYTHSWTFDCESYAKPWMTGQFYILHTITIKTLHIQIHQKEEYDVLLCVVCFVFFLFIISLFSTNSKWMLISNGCNLILLFTWNVHTGGFQMAYNTLCVTTSNRNWPWNNKFVSEDRDFIVLNKWKRNGLSFFHSKGVCALQNSDTIHHLYFCMNLVD